MKNKMAENTMLGYEPINLLEDLFDIANELQIKCNDRCDTLSSYEILDIAIKIQKNELYARANVIGNGYPMPSALEYIVMKLEEIKSNL